MKSKTYYGSILKLGLPILVGQLGMIVVGFADNIMVGRYSTEALASASFVNNLFNITIFCCLGFAYGLTPVVGALFSQNRREDIGATVRVGLWLNIAFTLLVMAVMTAIYFNLDRLGQPEELLPLIRPYYLIYMCGMLPVTVFNVFAQWSYGIKNTSLPMWIILVTNVINIIGNYILIYGNFGAPELGLVGAGLSTLLARVIAPVAIIIAFVCSRGNALYRKGYSTGRITRSALWRIWKMSIPVSMQMTFESGSFTVAAVMSGWLGTVALAAFQIVVITGTLGFCIYYSIGSAVAILVANEAGRSDNSAMRRVSWSGYHACFYRRSCRPRGRLYSHLPSGALSGGRRHSDKLRQRPARHLECDAYAVDCFCQLRRHRRAVDLYARLHLRHGRLRHHSQLLVQPRCRRTAVSLLLPQIY